jgi:hypothetical protein
MPAQSPRFARSHLLAALVLALATLIAADSPVGAAAGVSYAGVVVRHGDGRTAYAYVGFTEETLNGIELLKRTGLDVVTVAFGGLGEGVCSIDEHGCPATDCRKRVCQGPKPDDPFWQYFRQTQPGTWSALVLGPSSTKVHDGDIDGWSWTGKEPGLPPLTLDEVARLAGYHGTGFDGTPVPGPGAVLHREGATPVTDDGASRRSIGLAAVIVAIGIAVVVVAVRRRAPSESLP